MSDRVCVFPSSVEDVKSKSRVHSLGSLSCPCSPKKSCLLSAKIMAPKYSDLVLELNRNYISFPSPTLNQVPSPKL